MLGLPSVVKNKTNIAVTTAVRNASCSRGWLRVVVQSIFCLITVASFVMIFIMAVRSPTPNPDPAPHRSHCTQYQCKVLCSRAPFFDEFEDDIITAVKEASWQCSSLNLTLSTPYFSNAALPTRWLSRLKTPVNELFIHGGNLKYISNNAFYTEFGRNIKYLRIDGVSISNWTPMTLRGLFNLEDLFVAKCHFNKISARALLPVQKTLTELTIQSDATWFLENITSSIPLPKLTSINLSSNQFVDSIGNSSFTHINECRVLDLSFCKITFIQVGAFDYLYSIERINLSSNLLITIPPGLFHTFKELLVHPKIDLGLNLWYCDCMNSEIRHLINEGLLSSDPICHYPDHVRRKTFTEFSAYCESMKEPEDSRNDDGEYLYVNGECSNVTKIISLKASFRERSYYNCAKNKTFNIHKIIVHIDTRRNSASQMVKSWLKPIFYLKGNDYSIVEIHSEESIDHGLLWYRSTCPNEIYCFDTVPKFLRMYNVDEEAMYTFCPLKLKSGDVETENCAAYSIVVNKKYDLEILRFIWYLTTGLICLMIGAGIVYFIIRMYPCLLKGSKRVLFVKHKKLEAIVLPPKVPLRNEFSNEYSVNEKVFMLSHSHMAVPSEFTRVGSMRSTNSNAPSYISALQPTEDQLVEWRLRHHFDNYSTITSVTSNVSTLSLLCDDSSFMFSNCSQNDDFSYETLN